MFEKTWGMTKSTATEFFRNQPFQLAAALSYYTLLSMAPLLLLLTGIAGLVFGEAAARKHVLDYVASSVGARQADVVASLLAQAGQHGAGTAAAITALVLLAFGATTMFGQLQAALNKI